MKKSSIIREGDRRHGELLEKIQMLEKRCENIDHNKVGLQRVPDAAQHGQVPIRNPHDQFPQGRDQTRELPIVQD